jgi:nucleotidyltransferase substrate binding protein (TIGR01987 family)
MDRLRERLAVFEAALRTLESLPLAHLDDVVTRDAAIQRFEYSVETCWKAAQLFLQESFGLAVASPKSTFRGLREAKILDEAQTQAALEMVDDRNRASHAYAEPLARSIASRLPTWAANLRVIADRLHTAA